MRHQNTRRRGAVLELAILDAAWAELADSGWSGFTIAAVAARCGNAKPVVYRRWENRIQLAQDMLARAVVAEEHAVASSGDLRSDLVEFLHSVATFLSGPFGEAVRGVLSERTDRTSSLTGADVPAAVSAAIAAAVARGELPAAPSAFVQNVGHTLMTSELVHTAAPLSAPMREEAVDAVGLPAIRRSAELASDPSLERAAGPHGRRNSQDRGAATTT